MKKKFKFLLLFIGLSSLLSAKEVLIGEEIPNFSLDLVNYSKLFHKEQLLGKVTIIEFWATWCSPCISAMNHLEDLQEQFPQDLQVLAVSTETRKRIQHFVEQKRFKFNFATDSLGILNQFFPHRIIPHSILIDQHGIVRAITKPEAINREVIQQLMAKEKISLPQKKENTAFDYSADYFEVDSNTLKNFVIQPSIPGIGTFSKYPNQGPFADRRISMHNFMIDGMYRIAYQISSFRMVYEIEESSFDYSNPNHKYCLDIIVAPDEKAKLYPILIQKIQESFTIKSRLEKKLTDVAVLYRIDSIPINLPKGVPSNSENARGDYYQNDNASFKNLAEYLEDYGIVGMAVLDETNNSEKYQLDFRFSPEEKGSFQAALKKLGLGIKKAQREIDVLVIYE